MAATEFSLITKNIMLLSTNRLVGRLYKSLAILGFFLFLIYIFLSNHPCCYSVKLLNTNTRPKLPSKHPESPSLITNISHLVFGIAGTANTWMNKRSYIEGWWKPNVTRGYVFLDRVPKEPWPSTSPPYRLSEDISRYNAYNKHSIRHVIRLVHVIAEMFSAENRSDVRWFIMADDDTVFFTDNLVQVLGKYDHRKYFYIGMNSESNSANSLHSFGMAFGGAGYVFSYPLARALAKNIDVCIKTYPTLYGSDHILQSCVADFGISLTREKGFHQIDLRLDISGFLSAHPQSPFISLHHLDAVEPIFPSMTRFESVNHLMKAAKAAESRLLQQTICYHKDNNWTFSISWGYSTHFYEAIYPPSVLQVPLETFAPWKKTAWPPYIFTTRFPSRNPCEVPHVFFFQSIEKIMGNNIITLYSRRSSRRLSACPSSGNHSADHIARIRVVSTVRRFNGDGSRRECCDLVRMDRTNTTTLKLRPCIENEILR